MSKRWHKLKMLMLPKQPLKWHQEDHHISSKITLKTSSSRVHHVVLLHALDMLYLLNITLLSLEDEPKTIEEALWDADWVIAMQEELNNFSRNQVWTLEERPKDARVIGTKWVFRNKKDDQGKVVRNKARLVAKGFSQVEGLDFGETFASVARLEAIHILLAYASSHDIKLFQMDVKSAFLKGYINELVYVEQPPILKTLRTPSMSTRCPRRSMVSSKLLELGMRGLGTSSLRRASRLGKLTQHSSPRK